MSGSFATTGRPPRTVPPPASAAWLASAKQFKEKNRRQFSTAHGVARCNMPILRLVAKLTCVVQYLLEVQTDHRAGLLCHLIFNWQIEIISPIVQPLQRLLVLRQHRGANTRNIVKINPAQSEMP